MEYFGVSRYDATLLMFERLSASMVFIWAELLERFSKLFVPLTAPLIGGFLAVYIGGSAVREVPEIPSPIAILSLKLFTERVYDRGWLTCVSMIIGASRALFIAPLCTVMLWLGVPWRYAALLFDSLGLGVWWYWMLRFYGDSISNKIVVFNNI